MIRRTVLAHQIILLRRRQLRDVAEPHNDGAVSIDPERDCEAVGDDFAVGWRCEPNGIVWGHIIFAEDALVEEDRRQEADVEGALEPRIIKIVVRIVGEGHRGEAEILLDLAAAAGEAWLTRLS